MPASVYTIITILLVLAFALVTLNLVNEGHAEVDE